ncbi:MAG: M28 family peptidase [Parcubacteria group bacterium]|nr:M28 family peptidase [Parcubacteria group bacterium]
MLIIIPLSLFFIINPIIFKDNNKSNIKVNTDRLNRHVKYLTDISPARNYKNITSLNKAADYIVSEFNKLNCKVDIQKFKINNIEYKNIVCSFNSNDKNRLIVGAHYDVYGNQEGADDNASGVAGLLEVARLINVSKPELDYGIDLVAFTLEEPPFFKTENMGSSVYMKKLKDLDIEILGMICLEMIGFFTDEDDSQKYPLFLLKAFYPAKGNFVAVVGKLDQYRFLRKIKKNIINGSNIDVRSVSAPRIIPGIDFSDHLNFWNYGYDAVMITDTAFYRNDNYHHKTDTIDKINFNKMSEVVKGVYWAVIHHD